MNSLWKPYCDALIMEMRQKSEDVRDRNVMSIFIGGGTPSLIPYILIERIMEGARRFYNILCDAEISIESNPGTLDQEKLKAYREAGINRLSMGLQAHQDHILKFLGRIHTAKQFDEAVFLAKNNGFSNINADIIFGIPNQTFFDWRDTVSRILEFEIPHVSCYSLKIEEGTEFGKLKEKGMLEEADDILDRKMYHHAINVLGKAGVAQYEISNFAKPQNRCLHNMNYWLRGEYLGFGSAAHSFINEERFANISDVRRYMKSVKDGSIELSERDTINKEEALSESMILGLRLNEGVNLDYLSSTYQLDVGDKYREKLKMLYGKNLVDLDGAMVRLTEKGMDFANQVFVEFI